MNAQISTSVTIINSGLIGYQGISLTDFSTTTVSAIAAGSSVEIAGAFFKFSTDETINASSWTAITTATTAYLTLTPSGTAGSQILTAAWSSSAPVWSTSKQGWYTSAGSNIRVVASAYKGSATQYLEKNIFNNIQTLNAIKTYGSIKSYTNNTSGATYIIPYRGFISLYLGHSYTNDLNSYRHDLQWLINSNWESFRYNSYSQDSGCFFYSDGANFRFITYGLGTSSACTSYYQILGEP